MIYVLSDIHGNLRRFNSILEQIQLQPEDTLYILGDVIDRHPYGIQILCRIMEMPNVKMLLGNHEDLMMRALGSPYDTDELVNDSIIENALRRWYQDEGQVTHAYWKRQDKEQQRAILDYLYSLPLNIDVTVNGKDYKLVHGAPLEMYGGKYRKQFCDAMQFTLYKRLELSEELPGDCTVIFGHNPTLDYSDACPMRIVHSDDRIAIDCGSAAPEVPSFGNIHLYGRLGCLRLDDMKEFYSDERHRGFVGMEII